MKKLLLLLLLGYINKPLLLANEPDSVYLLAYATEKDNGRSGLHFAWSADRSNWQVVGEEYGYVKSDYGSWGSQKQMNSPYLFRDAAGEWHCIWSLNGMVNQVAHATSHDLITWGRQGYPYLPVMQVFTQPVVHFNEPAGDYIISFRSGDNFYNTHTRDFKTFAVPSIITTGDYHDDRIAVQLPSGLQTGNLNKVSWQTIDHLINTYRIGQYEAAQNRESASNDSIKFSGLKQVSTNIQLQPANSKTISDQLIGIFFEDINYAADGGIYAELIQNRDFEYTPADKLYRDSTWNSRFAWNTEGAALQFQIDSVRPIHANNKHYAVLEIKQAGAALVNDGYDGIALKKGEQYVFSLFAAGNNNLLVKLVGEDGIVLAATTIRTRSTEWKKYNATLLVNADAKAAKLVLQPQSTGTLQLDMVSLFPQHTFKNRKNGLRADLAETIAAIHPKFVRFPGGCVAHGDGLNNIYRWKNTIGPLESRMPQPNIWRYHQTAGLGYFEYFQFCEDIGAEPLPVLAAGVPCQNSQLTEKGGGQQGGIPMSQMDEYVQDILDLVEWANGPADSKWGKLRAAAGHPEPFHLKYIGIGNEDLITDLFEERFAMIYNAVKQQYTDITVIGTVGPFWIGTDYTEGWKLATDLKVPMVDEHYYESPGWFIHHQNFYDGYDRNKSKVYLGEYASRGNSLYNALAEALYLLNVERNADVVRMTSYAPLLAKEKHTQWNPDLIYFNNTEIKPTVNYEVQKLFGNNTGDEYVPVKIEWNVKDEEVKERFGISVVKNTTDGTVVVKMVNMLPVSNAIKLDLKNMTTGSKATRTVLSGSPNSKSAPVNISTETINGLLEATLPAYSFTVWKIYP